MDVGAKFKYISCYYLSQLCHAACPCLLKFKYISCYYLSSCTFLPLGTYFHSNTSHVIIYRLSELIVCPRILIKIHLMLLFIEPFNVYNTKRNQIQIHLMLLFISHSFTLHNMCADIQIHLMLLFIEQEGV